MALFPLQMHSKSVTMQYLKEKIYINGVVEKGNMKKALGNIHFASFIQQILTEHVWGSSWYCLDQ